MEVAQNFACFWVLFPTRIIWPVGFSFLLLATTSPRFISDIGHFCGVIIWRIGNDVIVVAIPSIHMKSEVVLLTCSCSYSLYVPSSHCKQPRSSIYQMSSEEISIFPLVVSLFTSVSMDVSSWCFRDDKQCCDLQCGNKELFGRRLEAWENVQRFLSIASTHQGKVPSYYKDYSHFSEEKDVLAKYQLATYRI